MKHDTIQCLNCGKVFEFSGASKDEMGWHTTCPECESSFDVDIEKHLLPNGTVVKLFVCKYGIVDGNDAESSEEFEDINYYIWPLEKTYKEVWSNDYKMLHRSEFSLLNVLDKNIKFVIANRGVFDKHKCDFVSKLQHEFAGEKEVLSFNDLKNALHFDTYEKAVKVYMEQPLWVKERCMVMPFEKTDYGECYLV